MKVLNMYFALNMEKILTFDFLCSKYFCSLNHLSCRFVYGNIFSILVFHYLRDNSICFPLSYSEMHVLA